MHEWEEKRLGEVASFIYGKAMTAEKRVDGKYDVYSSAGICGHSDEAIAEYGIIIGRKGTAGSLFYSKTPFFCIDTAFYVDKVAANVDLKFMYYYMQMLGLSSYNNDAAVPGLNRNLAHRLKIKIPMLQTQQKIADILSSYDDLIENNNRRIEILEKTAQNLYKEWFVRFRFPNYKQTKFENGLPHGWKVAKLGDVVEIIDGDRGSNYPKQEELFDDGYCLFLSTGNVTQTGFNFLNNNFISKEKDQKLRKGKLIRNDIVMTTRGTVGNLALFNEFISYNNIRINSGMVIIRQKGKELPIDFLYALLKSEIMKKSIMLYSSGSAQPQLPIKDMCKLKLILPSNDLIIEYNQIVKNVNLQISNLQTQNQNLIKQRDLLLPRLMSGKLEV